MLKIGPMVLAGLAALVLVAGACQPSGIPPLPRVQYNGQTYGPTLSSMRAEMLAVGRLQPTGLFLEERVVKQKQTPDAPSYPIFTIQGVPFERAFAVRTPPRLSLYSACYNGGATGGLIYMTLGTQLPPPYAPPAQRSGASMSPVPISLSAEDLLAHAWRKDLRTFNLEAIQPTYQGVTYEFGATRYVDVPGRDTSIASNILQEVEVLSIPFDIAPGLQLPGEFAPLLATTHVTDHMRIWRPKDPAKSNVLILDTCPKDLTAEQFEFWQALPPTSTPPPGEAGAVLTPFPKDGIFTPTSVPATPTLAPTTTPRPPLSD